MPSLRSTRPFVPKVRIDLPVAASMAWRLLLIWKISRRSRPSGLSQ
jgi:hypothetical protein